MIVQTNNLSRMDGKMEYREVLVLDTKVDAQALKHLNPLGAPAGRRNVCHADDGGDGLTCVGFQLLSHVSAGATAAPLAMFTVAALDAAAALPSAVGLEMG